MCNHVIAIAARSTCVILQLTGDAERMRIFFNAYISMIFYDKLMKFFLFAIIFSSSFQIFFPILI